MSAVNQALAKSAKSNHSRLSSIERIDVAPSKTRPAWLWAVLGFGISLAVGGWSVSLQAPAISQTATPMVVQEDLPSPTQKTTQQAVALYTAPIKSEPVAQVQAKPQPIAQLETTLTVAKPEPELTLATNVQAPLSADEEEVLPATQPVMIVEQVALTPEQLAQKALQRAQKAMESNDFQTAVNAYGEALRYTPEDELTRQKLAALYYGKGDGRKAFDLMQAGIERNPDGEVLRLALAKLLAREKQDAAALVPLAYLPHQPTVEYLSLRAALAQKTKQDAMALQSYQLLTEQEPNNGRWWLGLAIQQERALQWPAAQQAYQQALNNVGLSSQSQAFIQQRLQLLTSLQETQSAN
ncbi:tetratricopeptide repeat protein [Vibrio metoecus]|uniref:tetratricopeptide repeat protein n=1 Tax=Vibrio metoecus TaxID=1481663 RepID=UPI00215C02D7|nr:tetratricopeptide repeat protein [Vibrio metoecus]MCR9388456.1 tetratricopeptide repeat protein [Vibrio metoecus]